MIAHALLASVVGVTLLTAAGFKLADRIATALAAGTFGLSGRPARRIWLPLAALEATLAAGVLFGPPQAALVAAAVLVLFMLAQAATIAAGRSGAPCGCFGARGTVSWGSVVRTALLATTAAVLGLAFAGPAPWLAPAIAAQALACVLAVRVRRPGGALEVASEGPPLGAHLALRDGVRLAHFTSDSCRLCRALLPQARRLGAAVFDEATDAAAWSAAGVPGAPFAVALDPAGMVLSKGTVNTRRQLLSVLAAARERGSPELATHQQQFALPDTEQASSRRGFLSAAGGAAAALAVAHTVGVKPGDADAYHFCGHIFTTDGCPHPTGLPRIDSRGFPLRGRDGVPVDDLGRVINADGVAIKPDGQPVVDADGRPLAPATRTRICVATGRRYRIQVRTDGSWHRCCNGHVRKLIDCCTTSKRRINGDRALKGYCFKNRRVFCVMYYQTKVPC